MRFVALVGAGSPTAWSDRWPEGGAGAARAGTEGGLVTPACLGSSLLDRRFFFCVSISTAAATGGERDFFAAAAQAQPYQPAMADLEISDPKGDRDLAGYLWYPTAASGPKSLDFESQVWVGTEVVKDAELDGFGAEFQRRKDQEMDLIEKKKADSLED